jgi:hypothetical protein
VRNAIVLDGGDGAIAFGAKDDVLMSLRATADETKHLRPFEHNLHGTIDDLRGHGSKHNVRPCRAFASEASAGVGAKNAHIVVGNPQCPGNSLLHA